jgi:site-specific DNA recombinase
MWDATQLLMSSKAPRDRKNPSDKTRTASHGINGSTNTALLSGLFYDETGDRVSPSYANKAGVRYRYYVSMRLLHEGRKDSSGWRLPAKPLEDLVVKELGLLLCNQQQLHAVFNMVGMTVPALEKITTRAKLLSVNLTTDFPAKAHKILHQVIDRTTITPGLLTITVNRKNLASLLEVQLKDNDLEEKTYKLSAPFSLKRRGNEAKLIVGDQVTQPTLLDETLIKTKSNAFRWMKQLQTGEASTVFEIAKSEALDDGEISRVLPLAFLAPDIVEAILEGRQSLNLTARDLKRLKPLPISWVKQRQVLGFPAKI